MKLVFKVDEVAAALGKSTEEFLEIQSKLEVLGFPKPIDGLQGTWSIMNVVNWVNAER
jgi:hypothetical protein